jgi:hypothetical protein
MEVAGHHQAAVRGIGIVGADSTAWRRAQEHGQTIPQTQQKP